ncbi:hypothetical protein ATSB10_38530 [Dyella thiooxydans]|uniref:Organic solvent tolerance-like N-terminal domain-containing protein n=1 Tax=Dyella thiooxydans TaxID=445710 RepID=A0A160N5M0_9GAMM|nr:lipopolysaccharide transport periplasmic protein LptA [Dyella thiooxydans]AND71307.1 hypothetical protein ATSB10_38530 [Dyella thiooxydans]
MLPGIGLAKQSDRDQPMNYTAVYTEAFQKPNSVSTLKGKVQITQGTMHLSGDLAKIYLDGDSQISRVVVTGHPAHIQQLDDSGNLMTGEAATLDYDNVHGIAVLTTDAVVKQQGRGQFSGDKLTYDTQTSQITGESNGQGLVHGTFLPKPHPPKPAAAPAATAPAAPAPGTSAPMPAAAASSKQP